MCTFSEFSEFSVLAYSVFFLAHQYAPGDPLAVALGDDLKLESLLRLLENELPKTGRVLLGATAGVRQAMQDNTDMFSSLKVSL